MTDKSIRPGDDVIARLVREARNEETPVDRRDVRVMVDTNGRVAVRWDDTDAWWVLVNTPTPTVHGPFRTDDLVSASWASRDHGRTVPALNDQARDKVWRAQWANKHNNGRPNEAWSTGEQLIVCLILKNVDRLAEMGATMQEAANRLHGEFWSPNDPNTFLRWLDAMRVEVQFPGFITGDRREPPAGAPS